MTVELVQRCIYRPRTRRRHRPVTQACLAYMACQWPSVRPC